MGIIEKDRSVPALRFKKFSAPWEKYKLGELGENLIGLTYAPSEVVQEMGKGTTVLRSSNIKENRLDLTDLVIVKKRIPEKLYIRVGDILICTRNGSQRLIGKNVLVRYPLPNTTWGAFMAVFRSPYNNFLAVLFQTSRWYRQIHKNLGARINQITTKVLNSFEFYLPSLPEQRKIASFFSTLDDLIENIKKQKEKLEELKKGLMQRLFPKKGERVPELRFKGFEGEWREIRLGDIVEIKKGKQLGKKFLKGEDSKGYKYPVYNGGKLPSGYFKQYNVKAPSLIVSEGGNSAGFVNWISTDFWAGGHCFILKERGSKGFVYRFLYFYLKHEEPKLMTLRVGSGLPNIQLKDINRFVIFLPSLEEQFKLTRLFNGLDELIRTKERLLQNLLNFRKGLLQRMFI